MVRPRFSPAYLTQDPQDVDLNGRQEAKIVL